MIRTQELLAARRVDGAEQYFTRAVDFGYSKTADETMEIWGREGSSPTSCASIRSFRPDVIVTRFPDGQPRRARASPGIGDPGPGGVRRGGRPVAVPGAMRT